MNEQNNDFVNRRIRDLSNPNRDIKTEALKLLATWGSKSAIPHLASLLACEQDEAIIRTAEWAIAEIGLYNSDYKGLIELFRHPQPKVKLSVISCFRSYTDDQVFVRDAIVPLIDLLYDKDRRVRGAAAVYLITLNRGIIKNAFKCQRADHTALSQLLLSSKPKERAIALIVLSDSNQFWPGHYSSDPHASVRLAAAIANSRCTNVSLGKTHKLGIYPPENISQLASLVLGISGKTIVTEEIQCDNLPRGFYPESLLKLITDDEPDVRQAAAAALGYLQEQRAIASLENALKDRDGDVRYQAVTALGKLTILPDSTIRVIASLLQDSDHYVRRGAAISLRSKGPQSAPVLSELLAALSTDDDLMQWAIIGAITAIQPHTIGVIRGMLDHLRTCSPVIRFYIKMALCNLLPVMLHASLWTNDRLSQLNENDIDAINQEVLFAIEKMG